ncbi:hypothetical protein N7448_006001 [Penicillium atrosanguineum]|uniref:Uncharacterized protein n=1 Tax=Penicillium atrosanguineum TaxID=1132637 RepID=A0A9W9U255_9EURO|nr:uncharacterized protein N7443_009764 [Penicillium atrosanguineum]KAJ5131843.1 hypothetical protein N7448_006001 [Penicillium atrosanguineum]KAJ5289511.1 hypothetical protein N7443_009764 [Penicillium atrosanguineum]KAJ5307325.1 hypothetical protein N7476_007981 [Penicillium atrosanguineum]
MIHPIRTGLQGFCLYLVGGRASPPDLQDYSGNSSGGGPKEGYFRRGSSGSKRTTSTDAPDRQAEEGTLNLQSTIQQ